MREYMKQLLRQIEDAEAMHGHTFDSAIKCLSGHVSPQTAYVVEDYPYGFVLRCKIRYWLETHPKRGVRFFSQTSNPKREHVWNKPKASTYQRFGGCMYLNDQGHVTWSGCNEYANLQELLNWNAVFGPGMPEEAKPILANWIARKTAFNDAKARGEVNMKTTMSGPNGVEVTLTKLKPEIIILPAI